MEAEPKKEKKDKGESFKKIEKLGEGCFGEAYLARGVESGTYAVIK